MAIITNKYLLQSYILTTAKYDFSIYEKRILYQLVSLAQDQIEGLKFKKDCTQIEHTLFDFVNIKLPVSSILKNENDKNYNEVKKALTSLKNKELIYEDENVWQNISIISYPEIQKNSKFVKFTVHNKIWDCMLNFTKGYRKYELKTAMSFHSVYSMRLYELISCQKETITYDIEKLKEMFKVQDKYKLTADFIKRVIKVAKKELDNNSPYSFNYSFNKEGFRYKSINIIPIYQHQNADKNLEKKDLNRQISPSFDLSENLRDYLKTNFEFTTAELKKNIEILKLAEKKIDTIQFLANIKDRAFVAKNTKGYVINSIKKELEKTK